MFNIRGMVNAINKTLNYVKLTVRLQHVNVFENYILICILFVRNYDTTLFYFKYLFYEHHTHNFSHRPMKMNKPKLKEAIDFL